jgi:hypothetical protein
VAWWLLYAGGDRDVKGKAGKTTGKNAEKTPRVYRLKLRRTSAPGSSRATERTSERASERATEKIQGIRTYLPPGEGREWDPSSPNTVEGRLGKYNPQDFYAPTKDEHGNTIRITVELHPGLVEELAAIVRSRHFPFRDSIRQALNVAAQELVWILRRLNPQPNSNAAVMESAALVNYHYETMLHYETVYIRGRQNVQDLMAKGAMNSARKAAMELIASARRIPPRDFRERFLKQLEAEFGGLLRKGRGTVRPNVRRNQRTPRLEVLVKKTGKASGKASDKGKAKKGKGVR